MNGTYGIMTGAQQDKSYPMAPPEPVSTILDSLNSDLVDSLQHAGSLVQRARSLADRLMGNQPESVGKADPVNQANPPALRRLEGTSGYIRETLNMLASQLDRLEKL